MIVIEGIFHGEERIGTYSDLRVADDGSVWATRTDDCDNTVACRAVFVRERPHDPLFLPQRTGGALRTDSHEPLAGLDPGYRWATADDIPQFEFP